MKHKYRHEEKYLISYIEYRYLRKLLSSFLDRDSNVDSTGEYMVSSLYYDTWENRCFEEKQMGIMNRFKIRLRTYENNSKWIKLEIKNKSDQGILKEVVLLESGHAKDLIEGKIEVLLLYHNETAQNAYRMIQTERFYPTVIVNYEREAFLLPTEETRITFDKNIRANRNLMCFNRNDTGFCRVSARNDIVLEVKYSGALPFFIRKILSSSTALRTPVSKYCLARRTVL